MRNGRFGSSRPTARGGSPDHHHAAGDGVPEGLPLRTGPRAVTRPSSAMSLEPPPRPISTLRFFRLLLWVHWRSLAARTRRVRKESPLLIIVLAGLVLGYLGVGYWLFHAGLDFLYHFPLVGTLLSQRILYLIFGFFFVMLVFSNLIIGYSTLFRNRETTWLLSLPVAAPHGLPLEIPRGAGRLELGAHLPERADDDRLRAGARRFRQRSISRSRLVYLPFVIIPALFGSWIIVFLVRVLARPFVRQIGSSLAAVLIVLGIVFGVKPVRKPRLMNQQDVLTFDQLLRHTRLSVNPFLPERLARAIRPRLERRAPPPGAVLFPPAAQQCAHGAARRFRVGGPLFLWELGRRPCPRAPRASSARRRRSASGPAAGRSWIWRSILCAASPPPRPRSCSRISGSSGATRRSGSSS